MKKTYVYGLLSAEAALLLILSSCLKGSSAWFDSALAFPWQPIARGLGALSALGSVGRGLAGALWLLLGVLPAALALRHPERWAELSAAVVSSALLLFGLCAIQRPGLVTGPAFFELAPALCGCAIDAALLSWAVLAALRLFREGDGPRLRLYARWLLLVLCVCAVAELCLVDFGELLDDWSAAQLSADRDFALLRFLSAGLCHAFELAVALKAMSLLTKLEDAEGDPLPVARGLSRLCSAALGTMVAAQLLLNLLQLLFAASLSDVNIRAVLPLDGLGFALAVLLLSRLLEEKRRLEQDNSLFI